MASGSYEIDTYSWYRSLPLNGCTEGYSTGTMFAVGPCAFLQPYTFYQYQSSVGFTDTSTMSVSFGNFICTSFMSTTASFESSIFENRRQFVSTIPLVQWISSHRFLSANIDTTSSVFISTAATSNFPWNYFSTFSSFQSSILSSYTSSLSTVFTSTGLFGFINSNIYPTCAPYSLFSTFPVLASSFSSTLNSSINYRFFSTIPSSLTSSLSAEPITYDYQFSQTFVSTFAGSNSPFIIEFPSFWLGNKMQDLIDSRRYDVIVDLQYSLYTSSSIDGILPEPYLWVSSVGLFGGEIFGFQGNRGVTTVTRSGNCNYMEVFNRQMFHPSRPGVTNELYYFNSTFRTLFSATAPTSTTSSYIDIFMPGYNNMLITLVPTVSTII